MLLNGSMTANEADDDDDDGVVVLASAVEDLQKLPLPPALALGPNNEDADPSRRCGTLLEVPLPFPAGIVFLVEFAFEFIIVA